MVNSTLLHPDILRTLAKSGHGSRILIADGNYPFLTASPPGVTIVYLNLRPGLVTVTDVLETLLTAATIEAASVMAPPKDISPPIFDTFSTLLPDGMSIERIGRFDFYERVRQPDTSLVIATGEQQRFANILLTIGVRVFE
jgi:L-fucose mutarotase